MIRITRLFFNLLHHNPLGAAACILIVAGVILVLWNYSRRR
ncbi:MAG: hypothetical protein ACOX4I_05960 [Anaerovoracaceae bacterium]